MHEERWNTWTHAAGVVAALVGGTVLITVASLRRDPWQIVATSLFTASLVLLYSASTAYHAARDDSLLADHKVDSNVTTQSLRDRRFRISRSNPDDWLGR